jgi:hypothetical protein
MSTLAVIGAICLAIWLILMGAVQVFGIKFTNRDMILGILALVAGIINLVAIISAAR